VAESIKQLTDFIKIKMKNFTNGIRKIHQKDF